MTNDTLGKGKTFSITVVCLRIVQGAFLKASSNFKVSVCKKYLNALYCVFTENKKDTREN